VTTIWPYGQLTALQLIMRRWDRLTAVDEAEGRPFAYRMSIHGRTRRDPRIAAQP
jgi:hypothetical protein